MATGNWKEAAWAVAGAAAAVVGAGAAVKGARLAITAIRGSSKAAKLGGHASKAGRALSRGGSRVGRQISKVVKGGGCGKRLNSFDGGTPVLLAGGDYLPIAEIEVGDSVVATDPTTGVRSAQPVLDVIAGSGSKDLWTIEVGSADAGSGEITATSEHPFWVHGRGWVNAEDLHEGDLLQTPNRQYVPVTAAVNLGTVSNQTVFNLNVGNIHTFTVLSTSGQAVLVHNASQAAPSCTHPSGSKASSPVWKRLNPFKGKTKRDKGGDMYEWDNTHGDIERYDPRGNHRGSVCAHCGKLVKGPVKGRRIRR